MTSLDNSIPRELAGPFQHLRVFVASPGDVANERALALEALDQLPYDPLLRGKVTIEAVAWDKPGAGAPMLAAMTPQEAIKTGLAKPSQCDIVVVILWSRMGTPLPAEYRKRDGSAYRSGTEWEYLDALEANRLDGRPEILVYRRTERCLLDPDDPEFEEKRRQRESVKAFFAAFGNPDRSISHGANDYASPEGFRQQLNLHLRSIIRRLQDARSAAQAAPVERAAPAALAEQGSPGERGTPAAGPPSWSGSPFPGLRAFTPDDAAIFFGRGRETDELVRQLSDASNRFLMVVGASGSGKSSLVATGLIPRLGANAIEGAKDWLLPRMAAAGEPDARKQWAGLRFTPGELGDNPFQALAVKLTPLLPEHATTPRRVAEQLEGDPASLVQLVEGALAGRPSWADALLFIDQFEEFFTVVAERHQAPFVDMLAAAAQASRFRTVATLRADFYQRCVERPKLAEILRAGSYPLAAPGLAALLEMVPGRRREPGSISRRDYPPASSTIRETTRGRSHCLPLHCTSCTGPGRPTGV